MLAASLPDSSAYGRVTDGSDPYGPYSQEVELQ